MTLHLSGWRTRTLSAAIVIGAALGLTALPAAATEAHSNAEAVIGCDQQRGTIRYDLWATDHGDTAVVTDAWGLDGQVLARFKGRTLVAIELTDEVRVADSKHLRAEFRAAPGPHVIGVTLAFSSGFVSSTEVTVTVPPSSTCPTTGTTTATTAGPTTTVQATTTTTVGDTVDTTPTSSIVDRPTIPGYIPRPTTTTTAPVEVVCTGPSTTAIDGAIGRPCTSLPRTGLGWVLVAAPLAALLVLAGLALVTAAWYRRHPKEAGR